jgi:hypothetical protein
MIFFTPELFLDIIAITTLSGIVLAFMIFLIKGLFTGEKE